MYLKKYISFMVFLFAPLDEVFCMYEKMWWCDKIMTLFSTFENLIMYLVIAKIIMLTILGPISSLFSYEYKSMPFTFQSETPWKTTNAPTVKK